MPCDSQKLAYVNDSLVPLADGDGSSEWRLGRLSWGTIGAAGALSPPDQELGAWEFGYRGSEAQAGDGLKTARVPGAPAGAGGNAFEGLGWLVQHDAAERLVAAQPANLVSSGGAVAADPAGLIADQSATFGEGDEVVSLSLAGRSDGSQTGPRPVSYGAGASGRITERDGATYSYDTVGRRTEDARHLYFWNWRSELVRVGCGRVR